MNEDLITFGWLTVLAINEERYLIIQNSIASIVDADQMMKLSEKFDRIANKTDFDNQIELKPILVFEEEVWFEMGKFHFEFGAEYKPDGMKKLCEQEIGKLENR